MEYIMMPYSLLFICKSWDDISQLIEEELKINGKERNKMKKEDLVEGQCYWYYNPVTPVEVYYVKFLNIYQYKLNGEPTQTVEINFPRTILD